MGMPKPCSKAGIRSNSNTAEDTGAAAYEFLEKLG